MMLLLLPLLLFSAIIHSFPQVVAVVVSLTVYCDTEAVLGLLLLLLAAAVTVVDGRHLLMKTLTLVQGTHREISVLWVNELNLVD